MGGWECALVLLALALLALVCVGVSVSVSVDLCWCLSMLAPIRVGACLVNSLLLPQWISPRACAWATSPMIFT